MRFLSILLLSMSLSWVAVANAAVTGVAKIDPAVAAGIDGETTVFIFARAVKGPRMPLAMVRTQVKNLPLEFTLDDSSAMMPQMSLSSFATVDVVARVSRSGMATPASGDLEGKVSAIGNDSQGVELVIDKVLP